MAVQNNAFGQQPAELGNEKKRYLPWGTAAQSVPGEGA
jgi:hypothetical protein